MYVYRSFNGSLCRARALLHWKSKAFRNFDFSKLGLFKTWIFQDNNIQIISVRYEK